MTSVHVTAMYATKRRRRNSKNVRTVCTKDTQSRSNPSKRHRERLNQELDTLASLLPFEQNVLSKLDKLSILRLSVSYLRTKSYFQAALASSRLQQGGPQRQHYHNNNNHHLHHHHQQQQQQHHNQHHNHLHPAQFGAAGPNAQLEPHSGGYPAELRVEGDLIVQALNGFLLILTCDGEVFYTSHTVETYLGFHQSDICHQSVYELVHSEDREELMQQLKWNSMIPGQGSLSGNTLQGTDGAGKSGAQMSIHEILNSAEHRHLLERNFTVRFRCLLDNTSGFLRLDIRGRLKVLHGQQNPQNLANSANNNNNGNGNKKPAAFEGAYGADGTMTAVTEQAEPMLAFFGVCIPFGPPSLLEMPSKDSVFKSKHRLDLSIISMDSRGKQLLGLNDLKTGLGAANAAGSTSNSSSTSPTQESSATLLSPQQPTKVKQESSSGKLANSAGGGNTTKQQHGVSAYDLVHYDDLSYMSQAHQELLKTGASGLIAYRMITQDGKHQWLQTSAKLYYKNSKPDFILCTHRPLMEEEGRDLLGKRTMDFKVTYLDVGLSSINDRIMACDKFSSLQALGSGSGSTRGAKSPQSGQLAITGAAASSSSPALSSGSSRSLTSLSPQSALACNTSNDQDKEGSTTTKRLKSAASTYDLTNLNHQQQQYLGTADDAYATGDGQQACYNYDHNAYKRAQNGDIFYDMDAIVTDDSAMRYGAKTNAKKKTTKAVAAKGKQSTATKKKAKEAGELVTAAHLHQQQHHQQQQQQQPQQQQPHHQVDQQLQLYGHHYNQHHHHHHLGHHSSSHSAEASSDPAAAAAYPAIQAAAAYAASLGHHHQQSSYGSAYHHQVAHHHSHALANQHHSQQAHHQHHHHQQHQQHQHQQQHQYHQSASSTGMLVSPNYSTQHQHHSAANGHHLHSAAAVLEPSSAAAAAAYHQASQSAASYSSFTGHHHHHHQQQHHHQANQVNYGSTAAGSFLPTEHLLHHYSQSAAARSATLDYNSQQSYVPASGWTASAAAAAAAAALAASATVGNETKVDAYSPQNGSHSESYQQQQQQYQQHNFQMHQQQQQQQQTTTTTESASPLTELSKSQVAAGPASLNSDGSAHRSPLSTGESSNGSGSLTAAAQVAAEAATAAAAASYYLTNEHSSQQSSSAYAGYQQQHQHPSSSTWQYGDTTHFSQHHYNRQQQQQQQQVATTSDSNYFQQTDAAAATTTTGHHHHHHHHHHQLTASSAMAAVKLYGANGLEQTQKDEQLKVGDEDVSNGFINENDTHDHDENDDEDDESDNSGGHEESDNGDKCADDKRDPLAQLISSTIGDIMLDIATLKE